MGRSRRQRSASISERRQAMTVEGASGAEAAPANAPESRSAPPPGLKPKGMPLRTKFMLVMSLVCAVATIGLGAVLATIAHRSLFNQAEHKGIELSKMTAQVGRILLDWAVDTNNLNDREWLEERMQRYMANAMRWGDRQDDFSEIDSVVFHGVQLGSYPSGSEQVASTTRSPSASSIYIPRFGRVSLGEDIDLYSLRKPLRSGQEVPVYRYRIRLNNPRGGYDRASVGLDIRSDTIHAVSRNLFIIVGVSLVVVMLLVVVISNRLAKRITQPVSRLMRDMQAVAKGELGHRTKVHSDDEIGVLAQEFNRMTQDLKAAQDVLVEQEKARYELTLAHEVQQHLLPAEVPQVPGYGLSAFYKGAGAVSGDYYDFFSLGGGLWGFIVADVSGKGIPGSMVMAVTRTIVRLVAQKHRQNASETLKETNRLIAKQIKRGMFVTAFYCVLDQNTGRMQFASAGHNPMVIYRAAQQGYELAQPKGIAIGFNEGPLFDKNIQEFETQLNTGDAFVLYTDGFPEAMNEKGEEFGDDPFHQCVGRYGIHEAKDMIRGILGEIVRHRGRAAQSDDLTMIAVKRTA